jgi:hypothetical protein
MIHLAKAALDAGGKIQPLIIPSELTNGTGLFNPSIYNDNGKLYFNLRHCQYTLYSAELGIHEHPYGPLLYFNPENDLTLTTTNYFGELNDDLTIKWFHKVDTSKLDIPPVWEFVGLEDARIVKWDNKIYISGVRRDTKTNGEGRMELSELEISENTVREVSRFRIPAPFKDDSYCEKNWMPIIDKPYHYWKWCNPVEIVKADPINKTCEQVYLGNEYFFNSDQRGSGQIIPFEDGYLMLIHETFLHSSELGKKNGTYRHRFIHWSKDYRVISKSEIFSFLDAKIEFAAGLAEQGNDLIITFGFQDNAAYVIRLPKMVVKDMLNAQ